MPEVASAADLRKRCAEAWAERDEAVRQREALADRLKEAEADRYHHQRNVAALRKEVDQVAQKCESAFKHGRAIALRSVIELMASQSQSSSAENRELEICRWLEKEFAALVQPPCGS